MRFSLQLLFWIPRRQEFTKDSTVAGQNFLILTQSKSKQKIAGTE